MKSLKFWIIAGFVGLGWAAQAASQANFDFDWWLHRGDVPKTSAAGFDDSAWRWVNLPHDFSIVADFNHTNASSTAFGADFSQCRSRYRHWQKPVPAGGAHDSVL